MATDVEDRTMLGLQQQVEIAVLYRSYADAASDDGGDAFDRLEAAYEAYEEEIVRRTRERLLTAVRQALEVANADVDHARKVAASPAAGSDQLQELYEKRGVARGLARAVEELMKEEE